MPKSKTLTKKTKSIKSKQSKSKSIKKSPKNKTVKTAKPLSEPEDTVVLIYANWCPHCQAMKPEWNELKNQLGSTAETIEIEESDFDKDMKLHNIENQKLNGEKIEIYGYPTMFKIHNGHADYYGGNRTATEMYNWVKGNISGGYSKSKIRKSNLSIKSK
jgi:thiol-disulfide isomerase/thioredoxin